MLANSVTAQVMLLPLQSASVPLMPSVSVAYFTFCRPFAQAEEHTSHRKTSSAVITKSWREGKVHKLYRRETATPRSQTPANFRFCFKKVNCGMTNTHKNGSKVRILVDVHVAQINQQSHHAVQEADNADADEELRRGGRVSHHVCRSDGVVTKSNVVIYQWKVAQPGDDKTEMVRTDFLGNSSCNLKEGNMLKFAPKRVLIEGIKSLIAAIATEDRYDVRP